MFLFQKLEIMKSKYIEVYRSKLDTSKEYDIKYILYQITEKSRIEGLEDYYSSRLLEEQGSG